MKFSPMKLKTESLRKFDHSVISISTGTQIKVSHCESLHGRAPPLPPPIFKIFTINGILLLFTIIFYISVICIVIKDPLTYPANFEGVFIKYSVVVHYLLSNTHEPHLTQMLLIYINTLYQDCIFMGRNL